MGKSLMSEKSVYNIIRSPIDECLKINVLIGKCVQRAVHISRDNLYKFWPFIITCDKGNFQVLAAYQSRLCSAIVFTNRTYFAQRYNFLVLRTLPIIYKNHGCSSKDYQSM